ncbi:hypothetical protein PFISCL1PPCAC_21202, partial [Pristionchus fissidentatus]
MAESASSSLPVMEEKKGEEGKKKDFFPILDLPAELSSKILSYMGRKELAVCLQSFNLDKIHADLNKDKRIEELTIRKDSKTNRVEIKCSRYFDDFSSKNIQSSIRHVYYRFREIYEKCYFGKMTISISPNTDKRLHDEIVESCKRIKIDDLIISFPILELPSELSSIILSYMGSKELSVCLQSLPLDKLHAEWTKDKKIEELTIRLGTDNDAGSSRYGEFYVPFRNMIH